MWNIKKQHNYAGDFWEVSYGNYCKVFRHEEEAVKYFEQVQKEGEPMITLDAKKRVQNLSDHLNNVAAELSCNAYMNYGPEPTPDNQRQMLIQTIGSIDTLRNRLKEDQNFLVGELMKLEPHQMGTNRESSQADEAGQGSL